ncbi:MAG: sigma factor, partial [Planctomycetota bacterium]|nr:sigma factor [Planctomycetota bacterium]
MQQPAVEDRKLVEETLGGSPLAFQLLMERYQRRIFALARHYTRNAAEVEDLVQDTFLKAYT